VLSSFTSLLCANWFEHIHIRVRREKVLVPASKPYITFEGAGRDVTVVEWHDRASDLGPDGRPIRTYNTASVTVLSNYFTAKNISFKVSTPVVQSMDA
jgi:hypothetical protein